MSGPPPPPKGGMMSLYANLLDPAADTTTAASISRAPVVFKQGDSDHKDDGSKKPLDPALRFQPIIRRPQAKQANKPKPSFPKAVVANAPPTTATAIATTSAPPQSSSAAPPQRSKLADWAPTEEDEYIYGSAAGAGQKRERGGRRSKKKKKFDEPQRQETDWDEIYDPARPTNIEEYLRSDEKIREVQDWKTVLYAHRRKATRQKSEDTDMASDEEEARPSMGNQFAPPPSYGFAPPPPPEPSSVPPAETAEEAYARRLALSRQVPPPPPQEESGTVSRAPVRYSPPPASNSPDTEMPDLPPAGPPSKSGFAARIMSKYGWTKGTGLGAEGEGITTALRVQVEKRRRKADAEGGGFAEPGGRGKIIAPKSLSHNKPTDQDDGGKGKISQVVVLRGMLEGMEDLRAEVEDGLGQEIGEECGGKYGRVERVYVDVEGREVYIKFTDAVSALGAVNALEGRVFNGNVIRPGFYDAEKFERGDFS
ncbi:hypothetical protein GE09DRAFT_1286977 [Coniochaeta sp. 2T2.1]|nr:hypothetical protein GE09DRAFT_1286977 [Coniochaeta sp. 2T2.1]